MNPEHVAAVLVHPALGLPCCWVNLRYEEPWRRAHVVELLRFTTIRANTQWGGRSFFERGDGIWDAGRFTLILGTFTPSPAQIQLARARSFIIDIARTYSPSTYMR